MVHLKRNINLLLLIICVLCIGYILTLTTYYESNFGEVSGKYYEQVDNYQKLIDDMREREERLNQTSFELTRRTQDQERLGELYSDVIDEKELLKVNLRNTESELISVKNNLRDTELLLKRSADDLGILKSSIDSYSHSMSREISSIISKINEDHNIPTSQLNSIFRRLREDVEDLKKLS